MVFQFPRLARFYYVRLSCIEKEKWWLQRVCIFSLFNGDAQQMLFVCTTQALQLFKLLSMLSLLKRYDQTNYTHLQSAIIVLISCQALGLLWAFCFLGPNSDILKQHRTRSEQIFTLCYQSRVLSMNYQKGQLCLWLVHFKILSLKTFSSSNTIKPLSGKWLFPPMA